MAEARDDEELFDRWVDGDERAGQELFRRYFDAIHRFFRRQVGDDVQDLVQNTFLGCVKAKGRFEKRAKFRTFLFQIARFQLYRELRRRSRRPKVDFGVTSLEDVAPSPSRILGERADMGVLLEALARIPVEQQLALTFYYLEELTAPEVGRALGGLSVPAVRGRLRRGLERLRGEIERIRRPGGGGGGSAQWAGAVTLERWEAALPALPAGERELRDEEIPIIEDPDDDDVDGGDDSASDT
ncbi:MAG: sigma-70 family RNA polymerase sigma factor [Nannocystaceae bacterium]